jgi:hypothetical protein
LSSAPKGRIAGKKAVADDRYAGSFNPSSIVKEVRLLYFLHFKMLWLRNDNDYLAFPDVVMQHIKIVKILF